MQPQWVDRFGSEPFAQQLDGHRATAAPIACVENPAGSADFFQRHLAARAGERDVIPHFATPVDVIRSEVEQSRGKLSVASRDPWTSFAPLGTTAVDLRITCHSA